VSSDRRVALITGIAGQDGSYLAELLLARGYEVHGVLVPGGTARIADQDLDWQSVAHDPLPLVFHEAELTDGTNLRSILFSAMPDEIYHLAAQSNVRLSFDLPVHTGNVIALGTLKMLEAVRAYNEATGRSCRFYQAASSELFGQPHESPQNEQTPFRPRTPYACAKLFAYWQTVNYREAYGMFACNGILYNHESPRRSDAYVTRKITRAATRIKLGLQKKLRLGDLDARRDWGFAGDYVEAMWRMLQQDDPGDYVIATGETHSIRDLLDEVFGYLDLDWREYVETDPTCFRPTDVGLLYGDTRKARTRLGWEPKVGFRELVRMMADHDLRLAQRELHEKTASGDESSS